MSDDIEDLYDDSESGLESSPSIAAQEYSPPNDGGYSAPQAPRSSAPQYEPQDAYTPLGTNATGALDRIRARTERQLVALQKQRPVYDAGNGQVSYQKPDNSGMGWYVPIGEHNDAFQPGARSAEPIQSKTIHSLQANLDGMASVSSAQIFAGKDKIYQSLLQGAGGAELNSDNFFNNPYWDNIRSTGASPETVAAMQQDVLKAISPMAKAQHLSNLYQKNVQSVLEDPNASLFIQPYMNEISNNKGTAKALGFLNVAKEKAQALQDDSEMGDEFKRLQESQDPQDKRVYRDLVMSRSAARMTSRMDTWLHQKELTQNRTNKIKDNIAQTLSDIPGDLPSGVSQSLQDMVDRGDFKDDPAAIPKILKQLRETEGDVKIAKNGEVLPGLKAQADEKKAVERIRELQDSGIAGSDIYIDTLRHVYTGDKITELTRKDIKDRLQDTRIKTATPGPWIALDDQKFQDSEGNTVYLGDKGEQVSSLTRVYDGIQYAPRDLVEQLGFTEKELQSGEPLTIDPKFNEQLTGQASPYKAPMITADEFMDPNIADGARFTSNPAMLQQTKDRASVLDADQGGFTPLLSAPPDDPSFWSNAGKAFAMGTVKEAGTIGATAAAATQSLYHMAKFYAARALGDEDMAKEAVDAEKLQDLSLPTGHIIEAMDAAEHSGDFFKSLNTDNATGFKAKAGVAVGAVISGLLNMSVEVGALNAAGGEAAIARIGQFASKLAGYEGTLGTLGKFATKGVTAPGSLEQEIGQATEIAKQIRNQYKMVSVIRAASEFTMFKAAHGETSPAELLEAAATGGVFGLVGTVGRGFRFPWIGGLDAKAIQETSPGIYNYMASTAKMPVYADWKRIGAAGVAQAGIGLVDTMRKHYNGKSWSEIAKEFADPEFLASNSVLFAQSLLGQHLIEGKEFKGKIEAKPGVETPVPAEVPGVDVNPKATLGHLTARIEANKTPVESAPESKSLNILKKTDLNPSEPNFVPKEEALIPDSLSKVRETESRFMELWAKDPEDFSPKEVEELKGLRDQLSSSSLHELTMWTKGALAERANYIASQMNSDIQKGIDPHSYHVAEFEQIMSELRTPAKDRNGIPFSDVKDSEVREEVAVDVIAQHLAENTNETNSPQPGEAPSESQPAIPKENSASALPEISPSIQDSATQEILEKAGITLDPEKDEPLQDLQAKAETKNAVESFEKTLDAVKKEKIARQVEQFEKEKSSLKNVGMFRGRESGPAEKKTKRDEMGYDITSKPTKDADGDWSAPVWIVGKGVQKVQAIHAESAEEARREIDSIAKSMVETNRTQASEVAPFSAEEQIVQNDLRETAFDVFSKHGDNIESAAKELSGEKYGLTEGEIAEFREEFDYHESKSDGEALTKLEEDYKNGGCDF